MTPNARFTEFLQDIEPSRTTKSHAVTGHENMRDYIRSHETYKDRHVKTFLSGSYKRDTAIRPRVKDGEIERPDVDIIVTTNHTMDDSCKEVLDELYAVINEQYTNNRKQSRSVGVFTPNVDMDVVPIIEPFGEGGDLFIPDRTLKKWLPTNPPEHTAWTTRTNDAALERFKPLVKLFKWWRRHNADEGLLIGRHPKGFVLECIVAECMDYGEIHYGQLFTKTLEGIVSRYAPFVEIDVVPQITDPGVPGNSVTSNISLDEFRSFYDLAKTHAGKARQAIEEDDIDEMTRLWREIFGSRFPSTKVTKEGKSLLGVPIVAAKPQVEFPDHPVKPKKPAGFA